MARRKNRANYNSNPNYLDYLTALRKFFTNDADIIPIIMAFNFYINGVYSTPYVDLFRQYDENLEDIHGPEKTKQLIDDGTIGVINEQIYEQGGGSLITSLENLRIYLEDRQRKYTIAFNPFVLRYAEYQIPDKNDLGISNPAISINGVDPNAAPIIVNETLAPVEVKHPSDPLKEIKLKPIKQNPLKKLFKKLSFLSHPKNKVKNYDGNNY